MGKRIAVVGAGALGGYVGGYLAHHGQDVTLIDLWPENIEAIRSRGLELDGVTPEEKFTVTEVKTMHLTEVQSLATEADRHRVRFGEVLRHRMGDDADPALPLPRWLRRVAPELPERGAIAGVVGWGKTVGVVASMISVDMFEAARMRRTVAEERRPPHGLPHRRGARPHQQAHQELVELFSLIDSPKPRPICGASAGRSWRRTAW